MMPNKKIETITKKFSVTLKLEDWEKLNSDQINKSAFIRSLIEDYYREKR